MQIRPVTPVSSLRDGPDRMKHGLDIDRIRTVVGGLAYAATDVSTPSWTSRRRGLDSGVVGAP
jgi:hypothetical protein